MTKREKRLQKLRQNPNDVTLKELELVLLDFGFTFRQAVGSHHTYYVVIDGVSKLLTVPYHRPIKAIYVKKALKLIDQIIAQNEDEAEQSEEESDEADDD
jgi:predicted RNA binding protein YcfA (HicA-like mRNA interferase family)